jgi:Cu-Zn family superoxide dismutase
MRYVLSGVLSAMLLLGCSDDDGDDGKANGQADGGRPVDAGGGLDGSRPPPVGDGGTQKNRAVAQLESKSGSMVTGNAQFTLVNGLVTLTLTVAGAEPGQHGAHLHVKGDCSAADGSSAGAHWNPDMHPHGSGLIDASAPSHLGDLGNITIGDDKTGNLTFSNPEWRLGDGSAEDVVGKALLIHRNTDDLVTQERADAGITPGNSGARIACGVINVFTQ